MKKTAYKILISGGGTGGHIFPALAIANELKLRNPNNEILFVGANDRMEMEKVPAAGYKIIGLPVAGFKRKITLDNVTVIFKLLKSLRIARKVVNNFKPHIAIGVGGYASGPVLRIANKKNIPTLLQEQNSYAGVTNKILARKAQTICVAYNGMEKYFPSHKIILTGNPIRQDLIDITNNTNEALNFFNLTNENRKVVLILGGSLGARTINETVLANLDKIHQSKALFIWQTGKLYFDKAKAQTGVLASNNLRIHDFISRMDLAYSLADIVVSRAGAGTISELCVVGKPAVLIPSPNVAENHQTKNAQALVNNNAAAMVTDENARTELMNVIEELLDNKEKRHTLAQNIKNMARPKATTDIINEVYKLIERK